MHLRVDGIVLGLAVRIFKQPRRKMDVASIRLDAWGCLANARLGRVTPVSNKASIT